MNKLFNKLKIPSTYVAEKCIGRPRCYSTDPKSSRRVESVGQSLGDKGFLRPNKPYSAPADVAKRIKAICNDMQITLESNYQLKALSDKFKLLEACFKHFEHCVPNSQIHELKTLRDIIKFYETSVRTTAPYDSLVQMKLPENLHIQSDYVRFISETDTKFNGQTAFPKSSTLVTGLKYRGKYKGNEAKRSWP